jgi:hypothetical protein
MTAVVNHHRIRHAHMANINRQIMLEGMRADFAQLMSSASGWSTARPSRPHLQNTKRTNSK